MNAKRIEEYKRQEEKLHKALRIEQKIEDALGLEGEHNFTVTEQSGFFTVLVKPGNSAFNHPTMGQVLSVMERLRPFVDEKVPLIQRENFRAVWMPEDINFSAGGKTVGHAAVCLRQSGNQHYTSAELSLWASYPDVGWLDICFEPDRLPDGWRPVVRYKGFSSQDGSVTSWEKKDPEAIGGSAYRGASAGSWDHVTFWETMDAFKDAVARAAVPILKNERKTK